MSQNFQLSRSWRMGTVVGALAFGLVYLPTAFAAQKYKLCKEGQTKMCSLQGKPTCAKTKDIPKKEDKGYTFPVGGGNSPCPGEPASPT